MDDNNNNRPFLLSKYAITLQGVERKRYEEKILPLQFDPYLNSFCYDEQVLPTNVIFFEIYQYLVNKKSYYTSKDLKAFKSIESYKFYESGWVQYVGGRKHLNDFIVFGSAVEQ